MIVHTHDPTIMTLNILVCKVIDCLCMAPSGFPRTVTHTSNRPILVVGDYTNKFMSRNKTDVSTFRSWARFLFTNVMLTMICM